METEMFLFTAKFTKMGLMVSHVYQQIRMPRGYLGDTLWPSIGTPFITFHLSPMDYGNLEKLLDQINLQTDDGDHSTDIYTQSSTQSTPDKNHEPERLFIDGIEYLEVLDLARPIRDSTAQKSL